MEINLPINAVPEERPAAPVPSVLAPSQRPVPNTEDELFLQVERKCKINLTYSQKQLVQTYFMKIYRLGKRIERAEANAVFKNFRHESKFLEKTAEQVTGAGREEGKYWEAKRAELGIMFWASCAMVVLHHDKDIGKFPLLSALELLEIFPEFRSVSYDADEMEHLCKYHQVMAATMQAIDPANKKGVLMKVAGRLESASLYVTGGGASKKTKRRVLIYERLCEEGHVKNSRSASETSSVRSTYEENDDEEEYTVLGCKRSSHEDANPRPPKGQWTQKTPKETVDKKPRIEIPKASETSPEVATTEEGALSEEAKRAKELETEAAQLHEGSLLLLMLTYPYRPATKC
ncbi:hypothetical protein B484DRAFT_445955 [Ochromonadaceae sp. CCMP2298]|nr:hypothetical protein B484DRAFT_445955 [Ochromonadaceae sp. CCMP2298]|mmetsp:Transcript_12347/g.27488  ORF Transcript_12347/g.27488 Transcript_12347/m.27488 type:complete len:347 (+) Transcript_12347:53-1093(+)